jgi:O-6-methylguanine DNA methyltransferase
MINDRFHICLKAVMPFSFFSRHYVLPLSIIKGCFYYTGFVGRKQVVYNKFSDLEKERKVDMRTREEALAYGLSFPNTYQEAPFHDDNWQLVRVKGSKKAFLWTYERNGYMNLNVKVNPEWRDFWRNAFEAVVPGWHQNKEYWNTIILDGSIPDDDIKRMISESYDLVTDSPSKRIYEAVKKIPPGHVATYGQVAEMAGDRKMARAVGNALHRNPDPLNIPCFRVVNSKGECSGAFAFGGPEAQAEMLRADGVEVIDGKVNLKKYGISEK